MIQRFLNPYPHEDFLLELGPPSTACDACGAQPVTWTQKTSSAPLFLCDGCRESGAETWANSAREIRGVYIGRLTALAIALFGTGVLVGIGIVEAALALGLK